ncbi:cytochrome P450 [Dendrothele bispora CBS 962.96]|uniref:Cytochrome P450 n=1 Tax=Dendrothele bispora (strain CBS 962.96) TaxID=1314807 RepID=A0A4S8L930_DENBC|nr:cytochrome P450 [Dendrothele bispora CBS 962.96]
MMLWGILVLGLTVLMISRFFKKLNYRYPPGPRGLPILGNLFQLDSVKPWHTFAKWKEMYGPIMYLNVAGQPIVILNSKKVAEDLLERRASNYADRHRFIVLEKTTGDSNIAFMRPGERWRKMRRASEHALGLNASSNYYRAQTNESILLVYGILNQPNTWQSQIERASSSTSLSMVYDLPPLHSLNDPAVIFMNSFVECIGRVAMPGNFLVDMLSILEHLPLSLAKWKRDAEANFNKFSSKFEDMFSKVKNEVASGNEQRPSFCVNLAENQNQHKMSDRDCAWLAGALYSAGHETTATTMNWFIFSMIHFPEVQMRAQEELDRVVGRSRLPSFADIKHLPYIRAIVKEVLRWRPAVPVGVPHIPIEDDYYEGYFIPKGTLCIPCAWSINRDSEVYGSDADKFRPERHLNEKGQLKDETDEGHVTYGFGQRICAGRYVANNALFIQIAMVLWTMRLEAIKDSTGVPLKPEIHAENSNGIFVRPPPFEIHTAARSQDADAIIQQARDEVMEEALARPDVS